MKMHDTGYKIHEGVNTISGVCESAYINRISRYGEKRSEISLKRWIMPHIVNISFMHPAYCILTAMQIPHFHSFIV